MPGRINYKDGDKVGECILIREVLPIRYNNPNGKHQDKRRGLFKCKCGNVFETDIISVKCGTTKSCGCYNKERLKNKPLRFSHGLAKHPLYHTWINMKKRCDDIHYRQYDNYGGRGIKICNRWYDVAKFIEDVYPTYIEGLELDRIDNNGNYEPSNCRWITHSENNNNKRDNRRVEYNGEIRTAKQWSIHLNMKYTTLLRRLDCMSVEDALTKPFLTRNRKKNEKQLA